jgi:DNA excision repair protein ERCC-2
VTDADWRTIFGHSEPYEAQVDGIETAVETAKAGGYLALEGACGTGKTMLALTAGVELVRDPETDFERVLVLTSVKQQLRQFETDLRTINDALPTEWRPVSGLTMVGKADVCAYARAGAAGIDTENVYDECERLRDSTRALTGEDGTTNAGALATDARRQQIGLDDAPQASAGATYLEAAGEPAPYDTSLPEYEDVEYCPFYAQYLADRPDDDGEPVEAIPFDPTAQGLIDPDELVAMAIRHGSCPHSVMGLALTEVEVVLGNYYHAFDPRTAEAFTAPLLDDSTLLICDEAHMLEPRVRDLVSDSVADATLRDANGELTRVLQPLQAGEQRTEGGADVELVRAELADSDLSRSDLEATRTFIRALREEIARRAVEQLDREQPGWDQPSQSREDLEVPLRDPEQPQPDSLTQWAEREGFGDEWTRAEAVGVFVGRVLNEAEDERTRAAPAAGRTLADWARLDHERYFRSIELTVGHDETAPAESWRRYYRASLSLYNCVPGDTIGDRLSAFGGGILMSATLAPFDAFRTVTGLDALAEAGRPVRTRQYPLAFPAENRASFAVATPKFTYANRGPPPDDTADLAGVRQQYADALRTIASGPGNVLVGMPSYAEAAWAGEVLRAGLDKPVLLDEASDDSATQALKAEFFDGESKVLVTSLRGTLTEGVDYQGDRLHAAVVCGVPLVNTASPRTQAVRAAYDRVFGEADTEPGFEYALTIPAVRKARQAIGRVIRGPAEVGVRVLLDERYARDGWDSVRAYVPEEFQAVSPDMLSTGLDRFWDGHDRPE